MRVLVEFFRTRLSVQPSRFVWMVLVGGISNALLLYVLNTGATLAVRNEALSMLVAVFVVAQIIYVYAQRYLYSTAAAEVERAMHAYRMKQVERIRDCDLDSLEAIGAAGIFGALTRQTRVLCNSAATIVTTTQAVVVVLFALVYLAWLSVPALILALAITGLGSVVYLARMKAARARLAEANATEDQLFNAIRDLIDGFKEVRLNRRRSEGLSTFVAGLSHRVIDLTTEAETKLTELGILGQLVFFCAAAAMVFLLPIMGHVRSEALVQALTVLIYIMAPVTALTGSSHAIARASTSCDALIDLERRLEAAADPGPSAGEAMTGFSEIDLRGVYYQHAPTGGADGFRVGPIDLKLRRGEVLMISGGNGSGKSTVLKLLTSLYRPQRGDLWVDGRPVTRERRDAYQNLFSTVFSDFHLFERTFGLDGVAPERVAEWLEVMEIDGKTGLHDGRFDTLKLSTGQRKRLALVVAALEDRPICVLDEFAADQDPGFRRKFYEEVLPLLSLHGKTVVVVTHDERYFDRASRHLVMEDGQLVEGRANHV